MKPEPPKVSIIRLIITVSITIGIIIFLAARLIKKEHGTTLGSLMENQVRQNKSAEVQTKPLRDIITPCDQTPPPIPAVKHPAHTFKDANIVTVMEKITEWYKLCYAYKRPINNRFTGTIPADVSVDEALRLLEKMSPPIRFLRIETMQIIINPICQ